MKTKSFVTFQMDPKEMNEMESFLKAINKNIRDEKKNIETHTYLLENRYKPMKMHGMIRLDEAGISESNKKIEDMARFKTSLVKMMKERPMDVADIGVIIESSDYSSNIRMHGIFKNTKFEEMRYRLRDVANALLEGSVSIE